MSGKMYRILDENSGEVKELHRRWEQNMHMSWVFVKKMFDGYSDTGVYAVLGDDGQPVEYVKVLPPYDIADAYTEYMRAKKENDGQK